MKRFFCHFLLTLLALGAGAYGALWLTASPARNHPFFTRLPQDRPVVIAHRGGAELWPENTLTAFHGAVALGTDVLEMDVHQTAEGIPVVIHDGTVDRTTNGTGSVSSFTLESLRELDAGYHFTPHDAAGTYPFRGRDVVIPTLREVFEAFPETPIVVEVKEDDLELTDRVVALVQEFGRSDRTLLASFHQPVLDRFRASDARLATHLSEREAKRLLIASWLFAGHILSPPGEALLVPQWHGILPVTTRRFLRAAEGRNLFVGAWTINDTETMKRLLARGARGLITDRPDLAVSAAMDAR